MTTTNQNLKIVNSFSSEEDQKTFFLENLSEQFRAFYISQESPSSNYYSSWNSSEENETSNSVRIDPRISSEEDQINYFKNNENEQIRGYLLAYKKNDNYYPTFIAPKVVSIDVNETKEQIFTLNHNDSVNLNNSSKKLSTMKIIRHDEQNSELNYSTLSVDDVKVYIKYTSNMEGFNDVKYPHSLEIMTNALINNTRLSILKLSQHGDLSQGGTEIYVNNKGTVYIHSGIEYSGNFIAADIKFSFNVENTNLTDNFAELEIIIYDFSNINNYSVQMINFLLQLLNTELNKNINENFTKVENSVTNGILTLKIKFNSYGIGINDLIGTGLSFKHSTNGKEIEVDLENETNIKINADDNGNGEIIYKRIKPDGIDSNDDDDITYYTITNTGLKYNTNTTGNAGSGALATVFKNGVTIEYDVDNNVYEYALQASGTREYPVFTIEGNVPNNFQFVDIDNTNAMTRLNQVSFGKGTYATII